MSRKEIINRALKNNEISQDTAGQILMLGEAAIKKALNTGEIELDLAGLLLSFE